MTHCFYCEADFSGHVFSAREMMFGTREWFDYSQCPRCGSCMLTTPLDSFDLSRHYPKTYYSFTGCHSEKNPVLRFLKAKRGRHLFGERNLIGAAMQRLKPLSDYPQITKFGMDAGNSILDVGSGSGSFLGYLKEHGFRKSLTGCDPFIPEPIVTSQFTVQKCSIFEVTGTFDFIFFNHSFEHLLNPAESIARARCLQKSGGKCVIRIPTVSSWAFEKYGRDWVQLDPPRHISIPSREGMRMMAALADYHLEAEIDDSFSFQFWGSEQYIKDIPLKGENSYDTNPEKSIFSKSEIDQFQAEAERANAEHKGDQTAFVLTAV